MLDIISVFKGAVNPVPAGEVTWQEAIANIQSGKYQTAIDKARSIKASEGEAAYREAKKKLPAVTFCANFTKNRDRKNVLSATGFLIPDLDHLKNVDEVFNLLIQDSHIWFVFRSPSGSGLKCAVRATEVKTDDDIKKLYTAAEYYFKSVYGLKIDSACKDIARLTFVSSDPGLFVNPNPQYFDIPKWQPVVEERFYQPADFGNNGWKAKYGQKVLDSCCLKMKDAPKGSRHPIRLKQSRYIGGYVASGFIDEISALSVIESALLAGGTKDIKQAMKTVMDGIEFGKQSPLYPEERVQAKKKDDIEYYYNPDDNDDNDDNDDSRRQMTTNDDTVTTVDDSSCHEKQHQTVYNLKSEVVKWIENSIGCFTSDQISRDFCLTTRREKQNLSTILARAINEKLIKRDPSGNGKFSIIDRSLTEIDLFNTDVDPFDISLPFDLHKYCEIPKKGIILIAGSPDSGKTAFILNALKLNLNKPFQTAYVASEGPNEIKKRLLKFDAITLDDWVRAKYIERASDQQSYIESYNQDGLTLIDYLEEKDGEYFKITSQIRSIYDSLNSGVAIIGIQKHTESDYGRGGQGTIEKARLSASLDKIGLIGNDMIAAIKIMKIKNWIRKNLLWHELHFRIIRGAEIEPLTDWMPCSTVNRKLCLSQYQTLEAAKNPEKKKEQMSNWTFEFRVIEGVNVGLNQKDLDGWKTAYQNINVEDELENIANWSFKDGLLTKKGWFSTVSGILAKRNDRNKG